jgi:hypothetical protein
MGAISGRRGLRRWDTAAGLAAAVGYRKQSAPFGISPAGRDREFERTMEGWTSEDLK